MVYENKIPIITNSFRLQFLPSSLFTLSGFVSFTCAFYFHLCSLSLGMRSFLYVSSDRFHFHMQFLTIYTRIVGILPIPIRTHQQKQQQQHLSNISNQSLKFSQALNRRYAHNRRYKVPLA